MALRCLGRGAGCGGSGGGDGGGGDGGGGDGGGGWAITDTVCSMIAAYDGALLILGAAGWFRWDVEEVLGENWASIVAECASGEFFSHLAEGFGDVWQLGERA